MAAEYLESKPFLDKAIEIMEESGSGLLPVV
jgi:hypothetical protein